ncbi:MAG: hypothetical protein ACREK1_09395 [Longimicrobiales bacterium]
MRLHSNLARGAIAGLVAATALALWFLAVDIWLDEPFRTPMFLANSLLALEAEAGVASVAFYTIMHYLVFIGIGVTAASFFDRLDARPGVLVGAVLGFLLFDFIFYAGVVVTGTAIIEALGWPEVLSGSLVAGMSLAGTLALLSDEPTVTWRQALREHRVIREALFSALAGAFAVALWFLVLDLVQDRPFFTPAALGSALLYGARSADAVVIDVTTVLTYTGLHFAAFGLVGILAAALADAAETEPPLLIGIALLFVTFEALFLGLLAIAAGWLIGALQPWTIIVANLIAAAAMGGYLLYEHPHLRDEASHELEEDLAAETKI